MSPTKEFNIDVNGSVPRLELQAAVTRIELTTQILKDVYVKISRELYHTDSTTVYLWIQNKDAKHPVFVANCLNRICLTHPDSPPQQWRWVPTHLNPADVVSCGAMPDDVKSWQLFYEGPSYIACPKEDGRPFQSPKMQLWGQLMSRKLLYPRKVARLSHSWSNCYVAKVISSQSNA